MEIPYTYRFPLIHLSGGTEENTQHKGLNECPALPAEFPALLPLPPLAQDLVPGDACGRKRRLGTRPRGLGPHTEHEGPALAAGRHVAQPARGKEPASDQSPPWDPSPGPGPTAGCGCAMVTPWSPRGCAVVTPWSHCPCTAVAEAFPEPQLWLYSNTARHSKEPDPQPPPQRRGPADTPWPLRQPQQAPCALLPALHLPGCSWRQPAGR